MAASGKNSSDKKKSAISYWSKDKCICPVCKKDFQIKEKAYTDSNKITESILNIPLYAPATNIEDTLYYTILEKTLNDNPEIKKLKYKRILNTKK